MTTYTVLRQVDAWINYEAMVEAESPEEAAQIASEKDSELTWTQSDDPQQFDHREFYTLDEEGSPIESTKVESY
jgi:NADPH-dependent ferric siderophore reductase